MNMLVMLLQCGAFVIIPLVTLIFGIWKISYINERYQRIGISALIGFVFVEAFMIGMIIDPRSGNITFSNMIFMGVMIVLAITFIVFFLAPVYAKLVRWFTK